MMAKVAHGGSVIGILAAPTLALKWRWTLRVEGWHGLGTGDGASGPVTR